ncbi:hypothetical protein ACFYZ2_22780 [Streptomyces sviceus]|uniref:hypothetical protein n=1 Tax=Streptomyces sviceus TaxID=285530 RepID=UPI003693E705
MAAVPGLVAALSLGVVGQAEAVAAEKAPAGRWSDAAHGFASVAGGTAGGAGGKVVTVTVTDQASPAAYAAVEEPYGIRVSGAIAVGDTGELPALPAAVQSSPWTDMSGFSWKDAWFAEYRNAGPRAAPGADRPQLDAAHATTYTVANHLRGTDGWAPTPPTELPPTTSFLRWNQKKKRADQ